MFLVTDEKKSWAIGCFNCHDRILYVYSLKSEREKIIFSHGELFQTAEEVLDYMERIWKQ